MTLGLNLSLSGRGGASGGGVPSSVTHYWAPADMTFNGSSELTAITDRVAASSSYVKVQGAPTGNTTSGVTITEASTADYVYLDDVEFFDNGPGLATGSHYAFLFRRNQTADTLSVFLQRAGTTLVYAGIGFDGDGSTALTQNFSVELWRSGGADFGGTTRGNFWDFAFANAVDTWTVVLAKELRETSGGANTSILGGTTGTWRLEGGLGGFAIFTDWSEADAVETALLAEVA